MANSAYRLPIQARERTSLRGKAGRSRAYRQLTKPERDGGPLVLANCWVHFRRQFYDIAKGGSAPIATEALQRIAALYAIEDEIRGQGADQRRAVRHERTRPLVDRFECWLKQQLAIISKGSTLPMCR